MSTDAMITDPMCGVPPHIQDSLYRYTTEHIPTGGFLHAVLSNDLCGACAQADDINRYALFSIVSYLYNEAPAACWGSPEKVSAWLKARDTEKEAISGGN